MRRLLLPLLAVGGLLFLSGCSAPVPDITFFSSGASVTVAPLQYCDLRAEHCAANGSAAGALTVIPGRPVQVSAPGEVATSPWQVAARFRGANGAEYVACSPLFTNGQQYAYTVTAPHAGDQLVLIEVIQASATLLQDAAGNIFTPARGTWVVTAGGNEVLPKPGDNLCLPA